MCKKNYTLWKPNTFVRSLLAMLLVFFSTATAHAASYDYGDLELGKAYEFNSFGSVSGVFTAPNAGLLNVTHSSGEFVRAYADAAYSEELNYNPEFNDNGQIIYELPVTEGQVVYFYNSFCMADGTFTLTLIDTASSLDLKGTKPVEGSTFSIGGEPQISFQFTSNIKADNAQLVCGTEVVNVRYDVSGSTVSVFPKTEIYDMLKANKLTAGSSFVIRLTNVRMAADESKRYGTDGICEASFVSASKPLELVSTSGLLAPGKSFLSYWVKGDENGILRAEFDAPVQIPAPGSKDQVVVLNYGDVEDESGGFYVESVPYTVEGNTIVCDFTGKFRTPADMTASATEYPTMSLKIRGVRDLDGNYAYSSDPGALGSFAFTLNYQKVTVDLTATFTPESGTSLEGVDKIELWVKKNFDKISFDGILFTYLENGETKSFVSNDYEVVPDPDFAGATSVFITVPAEVKGKKNVTVSLNKLLSADGEDYTEKLTATYNVESVVESLVATPANGSKVDALSDIKLLFPLETVVSFNAEAGKPTLTRKGGEVVEMADATYDETDMNAIVLHTPNVVTEQGIYTIQIPEGYVLNSAWQPMPAMTLTYGVGMETGIELIVNGEQQLQTVYTLSGIRLVKPLSQLPAGVYIVNGKKVVLK